MIPDRFNLASALLARRRAARDAMPWTIDADGRVWTFDEVEEAVHRAGNGLRSLGIEPGQRVMIVLPDSCEFVAAFLGAVAIGAVAVGRFAIGKLQIGNLRVKHLEVESLAVPRDGD